tara:strand:+ start:2672 stop:2839 length:168 start_codon:yes stop_codon:yes gene_type:complete
MLIWQIDVGVQVVLVDGVEQRIPQYCDTEVGIQRKNQMRDSCASKKKNNVYERAA